MLAHLCWRHLAHPPGFNLLSRAEAELIRSASVLCPFHHDLVAWAPVSYPDHASLHRHIPSPDRILRVIREPRYSVTDGRQFPSDDDNWPVGSRQTAEQQRRFAAEAVQGWMT